MKQISTYTALYKPDDSAINDALSDFATLFGKVERKLYASLCAAKSTANERKREFIKTFNLTGRQYNAILNTLQAKLDSQRELNKLYQSNTAERIEAVSGTIKKLHDKATMLHKTGGNREIIQRLLSTAHQKSRYLAMLQRKQARLKSELNKIPRLCFGSKKRFNAQHHLKENHLSDHEEWVKAWRHSRSNQFCVIGSKDERMGNQSAQLAPHPDGTFSLSLRLPDAMGGGRVILNRLRFKYGHEAILSACAENMRRIAAGKGDRFRELEAKYLTEHGEKGTKNTILRDYGQALTVRVSRHKFGWQVAVTVAEKSPTSVTGFERGALGIDVNQDHLAVTVIDTSGNKVYATDIPCGVSEKGLSRHQRSGIAGDAIRQVIDIATRYRVGIVHEKLDFTRKKQALKETLPKGQRVRLSALAYRQILSLLLRRAWREGVLTKAVNPAFTSVIGALKYQRGSLTSHQAAAQVIARRGLGLVSECIRIRVPHKAAQRVLNARQATVSMPDDPFRRWQKVKKLVGQSAKLRSPQESDFVNLKVRDNLLMASDVAVRISSH